jgi:hypothetical protein
MIAVLSMSQQGYHEIVGDFWRDFMRKIILLSLLLLNFAVSAQDSPEVITAANVSRVQSVAQIDFADIDAEFDTGMFWMNDTGSRIVWGTNRGYTMGLDDLTDLSAPPDESDETISNLIAVAFDMDEDLVFHLYQIDGVTHLSGTVAALEGSTIDFEGIPLDLWSDERHGLLVESINEEGLPVFFEYSVAYPVPVVQEYITEQYTIPLAPDDVVRIGRVPLPYIVTSTLNGTVRVYAVDNPFGQPPHLIHEVDNGTGQPSVFGAINIIPNDWPTHLVWRDNASESLYLLNFETGENRLIAELNGDYAQWFFLGHDADVILAVNLGFEPNIVAWDVATGERTVLGEYRQCNRPQPDMARLSADGTTLVIGCDTGLDIWRIVD